MIDPEKDQPKTNLLELYWGRLTPEQKALLVAGLASIGIALCFYHEAYQLQAVVEEFQKVQTQLSNALLPVSNDAESFPTWWNRGLAWANYALQIPKRNHQVLIENMISAGKPFARLGPLLVGISEISATIDSFRDSPAPATNRSV